MNIKTEIERIFEENGINISDPDSLENIDSIQYVTIIVEIEQIFNITLPDYFLVNNALADFQKLINIVTDIYENSLDIDDSSNNTAMLSKNVEVI